MDSIFFLPQFQPNPLVLRPKDNVCPVCGGKVKVHKRRSRVIRFASEKLPTDPKTTGEGGQSSEINNTQYPEFKKWLPEFLIKKDITKRESSLILLDPNHGVQFGDIDYKGTDIVIEFTAYHQTTQAQAGVQRMSTWLDEHPPIDFYEEQFGRLFTSEGDFVFTLTPAMGLSWEYDEIFEKACLFVRTKAICDFLGPKTKQIESTDSENDIAVVQAATDDNPTIPYRAIVKILKNMPDIDGTTLDTRRFGIFKQASGRIFKDFNFKVHVIDPKNYEINQDFLSACNLGRSMDWHPANPHAIIWGAISKQDEVFIYQEWAPSPGEWTMEALSEEIVERSGEDKFSLNIVDPLINGSKTGKKHKSGKDETLLDVMNEEFYKLKKMGKGQAGVSRHWDLFNTKGLAGRDEIMKRLQNSLKVGKPFNNKIIRGGLTERVPTLWVLKSCPKTARSLKHWRLESWASNRQLATKDRKESPAQKHSHFCTALECLLKDRRFRPRKQFKTVTREHNYFHGRN